MPAHHGQTYDPNEPPTPRGGWFRLADRPYPERLDRAFRMLAAVVGIGMALATTTMIAGYAQKPPADLAGYAGAAALVLALAALAYGFTRGIGMIAVAVYGTARDGSELVVDWGALRHDIRLRRTQVVLLELTLLVAAMGGMAWGLILFVREGLVFGLAMFALINAMAFWPYVRRWWLTGRAD